MKFKLMTAPILALAMAGTAYAQIGPSVGATVYGPEGNVVGTITEMTDEVVTVNTGEVAAPVPTNAFGEGPEGPVISVTQDQLNQMMAEQRQQQMAQRDAALATGNSVMTADGVAVGTIEEVNGNSVLLALEDGPVNLTRDQFAVNGSGALIVLFTETQLENALANAGNEGVMSDDAVMEDGDVVTEEEAM